MSKFFKHAPVQESFQKRLSEALGEGRHVLAGLPWGSPAIAVYAYPALLGSGLAVAVCPDRLALERNLDYLARMDIRYPEVAVFEAGVDHLDLQKHLDRNRVRLLFTTPERFSSLNFMDILVHARLSFLLVEEAERLLPIMPGYGVLEGLKEGLDLFRQLPPMVLMVPPMAPGRLRELAGRLRLSRFQLIGTLPDWERMRLSVRFLMNESQKLRALIQFLQLSRRESNVSATFQPVLIHTAHPAEAEKLAAALAQAGLDPVWSVNDRQDPRDVAAVEQVLSHRPHTVLVSAGVHFPRWQPPRDVHLRMIYWSTPGSLDEVLATLARTTAEGGFKRVEGLILHTRDDYCLTLDRLHAGMQEGLHIPDEQGAALQHYRRWLFSEDCRLQTLAAYCQGTSSVTVPPCGGCDRCLPRPEPWLKKTLRRWLY